MWCSNPVVELFMICAILRVDYTLQLQLIFLTLHLNWFYQKLTLFCHTALNRLMINSNVMTTLSTQWDPSWLHSRCSHWCHCRTHSCSALGYSPPLARGCAGGQKVSTYYIYTITYAFHHKGSQCCDTSLSPNRHLNCGLYYLVHSTLSSQLQVTAVSDAYWVKSLFIVTSQWLLVVISTQNASLPAADFIVLNSPIISVSDM